MQVRLNKPDLEKFVTEEIRAGRFPTPEAVVESALSRMRDENAALTDDDIAGINEAERQIDSGDFVEFDAFAKKMRAKYAGG